MKLIKWLTQKKTDSKSALRDFTPEEFDKVKFKARIAFIDDEEITHIERLRKDGYNITSFSDIESIDDFVRKKYHVVVLDIQGVGQNIAPKTEGWGILKYLKSDCPNMVVIMYTGAEWSITKYKEEAEQADDFIGKDLEFLDFKSKLDDGIKKAFSLDYHFNIEKKNILKELSNSKSIEEIRSIAYTYGEDKSKAITLISKITNNKVVLGSIEKFLSIANGIKELLS